MASKAISRHSSSDSFNPFEIVETIKISADSCNKKVIPPKFNLTNEPTARSFDSVPLIDFSALVAANPNQRSKAVHDLVAACTEPGFFLLVNHGIPDSFINEMLTTTREFFNLPETEKKLYETKGVMDPIKFCNANVKGTSNHTFTLWREYLKIFVHPELHCPQKPDLLREVVMEYTHRVQELFKRLMEALCNNLEIDADYLDEALNLDSSFQVMAANYYPPCPHPDQEMGLMPHTDPGLFTFIITNGVSGLEVERDGQWYKVEIPKTSMLVNTGDNLEIFSNGRCKSIMHRAVVNEERERLSVVLAAGLSREALVGPAAALVEKDGRAKYGSMKYGEFMEWQQTNACLDGITLLEKLKTTQDN